MSDALRVTLLSLRCAIISLLALLGEDTEMTLLRRALIQMLDATEDTLGIERTYLDRAGRRAKRMQSGMLADD